MSSVNESISNGVAAAVLQVLQQQRHTQGAEDQEPSTTSTNHSGAIDIPLEALTALSQAGSSKRTMADVFNVSVSTIKRRLTGYNIRLNDFPSVSDNELKVMVRAINQQFPNSGYREMQSMLRQGSSGQQPLRVKRDRVAKILREVDPEGTKRRWSRAIQRRVYRVSSPNSLWHLDTHHKLIRWNIVILGCIDGFSRLVPYMRASPDNLATTSFRGFLSGVNAFGIPTRCRGDDGGENVLIRRFMQTVYQNESTFLTGPSVHNQRIERLWRDVFEKVVSSFYTIFCALEEARVLESDNDLHIFALHYVFMEPLQTRLTVWCNAHNMHPIRTEKNRTPIDLWLSGIISKRDDYRAAGMALSMEVSSAISDFTRNVEGFLVGESAADQESHVHVHTRPIIHTPSEAILPQLQRLIPPPAATATDIELACFYRRVLSVVSGI